MVDRKFTGCKTAGLAIAFSAAIAFPCMAGGSAESFKLVRVQKVEHKTNIAGFETEQFGITGGYAGESHITADGGSTWPKSDLVEAACRFSLDIVDASSAVTGGNGGIVMTTDCAKTWKNIYRSRCENVSFIDPSTGWFATNYKLYSIVDGKECGAEIPLPKNCGIISSVAMTGKSGGYILDDKGMLYRTSDGGISWTATQMRGKKGKTEPIYKFTTLRFRTPEEGLALIYAKTGDKNGWLAMSTSDGGKTWKTSMLDAPFVSRYISRDCSLITLYDSGKKTVSLYSKAAL